ncbi:Acyl-CoA N-acyltransferases (Nat) [Venustampulla echinocandica]|uniref:Acyl-CoA N-acyltransferases (Nat) n=1 Tax=Venustampulla echinocandica TaxID=2656787 RepID=A0A370TFS0_9HELO|nr:Acyl-CoA N-acyltransferases (Nat) [Venustampulla echinocandica]RDL33748.1 Acyl-CoA N-acyltransferases (Nat) [Venustampulla echinocandica]
MHLRPYNPSDISSMATIEALCNLTDPLERFRSQKIESNWDLYRSSLLRYLQMLLLMPGVVCWVIEGDLGDEVLGVKSLESRDVNGEVIGWAIWGRDGVGPVARNWQMSGESCWNKFNLALQSASIHYFSIWDPTINHSNVAKIQPIISTTCEEASFTECWHLHGLYILPTCQRRGLGSLAVKWGITQSAAEKVPIVVNSSSAGVPLYEKLGFKRAMKQEFDQFFETGGEGMWTMVWDPKDQNAV